MDSLFFEKTEVALGAFTFLLTTYLGVMVFTRNKKSWTSRLFLILAILIDVYIVVNYLSLHPPLQTPENQLFWIRLVMFVCSFIGPTLLFLVHTFPGAAFKFPKNYFYPLIFLMILSAVASLLPFVFTSITYPNGQPIPKPGPGMPIFFIDFVGLFLASFIVLIYKYRRVDYKEKIQQKLFLLGVLATFSFMAASTVIAVVVLKTSAAVFLGPVSAIILMLFITYAIFKHRLFDVKVIAAEALALILNAFLLARLLLSQNFQETLENGALFAGVLILSIFLVRSALKEIKNREAAVRATALYEANQRLREVNKKLLELDRQKDDFLSMAAHQLRTPLSVVNGYLSLIKEGAYGEIGKELHEVLEAVDQNNFRLTNLVDTFLNVSSVDNSLLAYSKEQFDGAVLLKEIVDQFGKSAQQKGLEIKLTSGPGKILILIDRNKLRQIITNFVDNAIKYSEHGVIAISVKNKDNGVEIKVIDQGIGFNPKDSHKIFEKFYRTEEAKKVDANHGTGLGLYICNRLVKNQGGKIWANSNGIGKGSEFGIWLPL